MATDRGRGRGRLVLRSCGVGESFEESPELEEPVRSGEPSGVGGFSDLGPALGPGITSRG